MYFNSYKLSCGYLGNINNYCKQGSSGELLNAHKNEGVQKFNSTESLQNDEMWSNMAAEQGILTMLLTGL